MRLIKSWLGAETEEEIAPDHLNSDRTGCVPFRIHTEDEYENALQRIAELRYAPDGSLNEYELLELLAAVDLWECRRDSNDD